MPHGLIQRLPLQGAEDHPCSHRCSVYTGHAVDVDGASIASMLQGWPHQWLEVIPLLVVNPLIGHSKLTNQAA